MPPITEKRVPVAGPWITEKEISYVTDAVTNAWYAGANSYNERFEAAFARHAGVKHALALPSCTSAIHLSLLACGVGPGDEVIVPDVTWIASAAPISYVGATPVFADIEERGWCLSPASFERLITPRTKAVIPIDLYGNMPDMDAIRALAEPRGIKIIEDAAEAVGATYKGKPAGSLGTTGVFSFHGTKTLTTGEGGMLVTNDDAVAREALILRDHGRAPGDKMFWNSRVGHKYKMSSLQAALGLAQLERLDELIARKRRAFAWYQEELGGIKDLTLNYQAPGTESSFWMATVIVNPRLGVEKDELMRRLSELGVDSRPFFRPLSSLPAYSGHPQAKLAQERNSVAYRIAPYGLNMPSALTLERADVARACAALRTALRLS
jgi:perosamine synthetase